MTNRPFKYLSGFPSLIAFDMRSNIESTAPEYFSINLAPRGIHNPMLSSDVLAFARCTYSYQSVPAPYPALKTSALSDKFFDT